MRNLLKECPPPARFRGVDKVDWACFTRQPDFLRPHKHTGRRLAGVKYEGKVQEYLVKTFPESYLPSPWLQFFYRGSARWCQPDGLFLFPAKGEIIVTEVKYQHTSDAWWQLHHLYGPVLSAIFPRDEWKYSFLEVVKWYDPNVAFPCQVKMMASPLTPLGEGETGVHIWTP